MATTVATSTDGCAIARHGGCQIQSLQVGRAPRAAPSARTRGGLLAALFVAASWATVLTAAIVALSSTGSHTSDAAAYLLVWLASTTLPGVLVWRVVDPTSGWTEAIGFGNVLGIGLLLLGWALAVGVGIPLLMWLPAVVVIGAVLAVERLRRRLRFAESRVTGRDACWNVAMCAVGLAGLGLLYARTLRTQPLPPAASATYSDLWYHLSMVDELGRTVVPSDPSALGEPLRYHWFSNADMYATAALSRTSTAEVLLHLWLVPMLITLLLAIAATTSFLIRGAGPLTAGRSTWWAGPIAALVGGVLAQYRGLEIGYQTFGNGFLAESPSSVLAIVVVLATVGAVGTLLRGPATPATWVLALAVLTLGSGSKPIVLPVAAAGAALLLAGDLLTRHRLNRRAVGVVGSCLVLAFLASTAVTGSTGGSRIQFLHTITPSPGFAGLIDEPRPVPGSGGWLAPVLSLDVPGTWEVGLAAALAVVLAGSCKLVGVLGLVNATIRADPAWWFASGIVVAGFVGMWSLAHPGFSQIYFWSDVGPLGFALAVAAALLLAPAQSRVRTLVPLGVVTLMGVAAGILATARLHHRPTGTAAQRAVDLMIPIGLVVGTVLLLATAQWALSRGRPRPISAMTLVVTVLVASAAVAASPTIAETISPAVDRRPISAPRGATLVSAAEQRSALWLRSHSAERDVVATNVMCLPPRFVEGCNSKAFWVAALTGRRLLLGGWAYTAASLSADPSTSYAYRPSPWPDRLRLSLAATENPTPQVIARLRSYGVRFIFADRRAGRVSPDLARLARLRFEDGQVQIYELDRL